MSGDWADDKATEVMHLIFQPEVTLEQVCEIIAENLRLADAKGEHRGLRFVSEQLGKLLS